MLLSTAQCTLSVNCICAEVNRLCAHATYLTKSCTYLGIATCSLIYDQQIKATSQFEDDNYSVTALITQSNTNTAELYLCSAVHCKLFGNKTWAVASH